MVGKLRNLSFRHFLNFKFSTVAWSTHFGAWFLSTLPEPGNWSFVPCDLNNEKDKEQGFMHHSGIGKQEVTNWCTAPKINGVDVMMSNWVVRSRPRGRQKSSGSLELTQWALQYFGKALMKIPSNQKWQHLGYKTTESVWLRQVRISHFSLFISFILILGH